MKKTIFKLFTTLLAGFTIFVSCNNNLNTGNISGKIILDGSESKNEGFIISVAGTNFQATTNTKGDFLISDVPEASDYEILILSGNYIYNWKTDVAVLKNETTDLGTLNLKSEDIKKANTTIINNDITYNLSNKNPITVAATDRGITFSYEALANSSNTTINGFFSIKERESNITLSSSHSKTCGSYNIWSVTYPFVQSGKTYTFDVSLYHNDVTIADGSVTITAMGGLGEYKIENANEIKTTLSSEKIISRTAKPEFTDNPNVTIANKAVMYSIYRDKVENDSKFTNIAWVYDTLVPGDFETNNFDIKDIYTYTNWLTYDTVNNKLSGHKYLITTRTVLKVSGYTNDDTKFYMNDICQISDDWGGERYKVAIIYGVDIGENNIVYSGDDISSYTGLPGTSKEITINEETKTYPFVVIEDYCVNIPEPSFTLKKDGNPISYKWNIDFPLNTGNLSSSKAKIDGKEYGFIMSYYVKPGIKL